MFDTSILEVAIGLTFVYLLLSLICSAVNEGIESVLKNRATDLERGIREIFNQEGGGELVAKFYNHPLISGLFRGPYGRSESKDMGFGDLLTPTNLPSYIPARNFAYTVIDLVLHPPAEPNADVARDDAQAASRTPVISTAALPVSMDALRSALRRTPIGDTQVGRALRALAEQAGEDVNVLRENVETWFNSAMDRVSGTYKRRTQWIIFVLGFLLTVFLNVNSVTIANRLTTDATLRSVVVAEAEGFASRPDAQKPDFEKNKKELQGLGLPLGWPNGMNVVAPWNKDFRAWQNFLLPLIGWLLTAAAISLGAPFWFDVLNKFMVIRATVKPHEKSGEEGSEDRQPRANLMYPVPSGSRQPAAPDLARVAGAESRLPTPTSPVAQVPEPEVAADPDGEDNESDLEGCDLGGTPETADEELPPTRGGVG
jgi:hypothetical protein